MPKLPPLGLLYLASSLEKNGHSVRVIDLNIFPEDLDATLLKDIDIVGITATTPLIKEAWRLVKIVKKAGLPVILGGPHPSALPKESLDHGADIVVRGEGEITLVELLANWPNKEGIAGISYMNDAILVDEAPRQLIQNLDDLPFPAYHLLENIEEYTSPQPLINDSLRTLTMITSRGCPYGCNYCFKEVFGRAWRAHSPKYVVDLWQYLYEKFKVKMIGIEDDSFNLDYDRVIEICRLLKERGIKTFWTTAQGMRADSTDRNMLIKMKEAGLLTTGFGIESGTQESIDKIGKGLDLEKVRQAIKDCRELGIESVGNFMLGNYFDDKETMQETIDLACELDPDIAHFSIAVPMPGTSLYKMIEEKGKFLIRDWDLYGYVSGKCYFEIGNLKKELVEKMWKRANRQFYLRPKVILKMLSKKSTWLEMPSRLKAALSMLGFAKNYSSDAGLDKPDGLTASQTKKFLFIQKNSFPAAGPMIISALLKKHGFEVDLLLVSEEKHLKSAIKKISPDVVGISCFTGQHEWSVKLCQNIKKHFPDIITLLGGPHPTYYPEIIKEKGVDIIARGEAEYAILELMQKLQKKESIDSIKNLWIKKDGRIIENEMDCLPANLDDLPLPDREIYYKYKFLRRVSVKQFLSGRGCPFQCTFCANNILKKIYQGKGKFVRRRSPEGVVEEILDVKKKYGLRVVSFTDDVFITDIDWLKKFLPLYKEKVNLPFMCNVTANLITEEIASLLKDNCCYGVSMGIESGDEEIRFKVMKKFISDKQIIETAGIIKKHKLSLKTFNILCLPGETIEKALKTMELNAKIKSDFAACTLLQPFPEYDITNYAKEHGYLPPSYGVNDVMAGLRMGSPMIIADKDQFINLQSLFFLGVKMPWLIPIIKRLIKMPPNFIFTLVGKFTYGFFMSRTFRLTFVDMLNYAMHIDPYDV